MKPTKPGKLREMTDEELRSEEVALTEQLFKLRFQATSGQQEDPVRVRVIRRNRARIKSILREREIAAEREKEELRQKLDLPIAELDLSVRAANCMEIEGIATVGDLCGRTEDQLLEIRNFGKTSLKEINKKLSERGLSLGMDVGAILEA